MIDYVQQALLADRPANLGIAAQVVDLAERGVLAVGHDDTGAVVLARRNRRAAVDLSDADVVLLAELHSEPSPTAAEWQLTSNRFSAGGQRLERRAEAALRAAGLWESRMAAATKVVLAAAVAAGLVWAGWVAFGWTDADRLPIGGFVAFNVLSFGWLTYDVLRKRMRPTATGHLELAGARQAAGTDRLAPLVAEQSWRDWPGLRADTPPAWLTTVPWHEDPAERARMLDDLLHKIRGTFREPAARGN